MFPGKGNTELVMSVSRVREHISLVECFFPVEENISLGIVPVKGNSFPLGICVKGETYH